VHQAPSPEYASQSHRQQGVEAHTAFSIANSSPETYGSSKFLRRLVNACDRLLLFYVGLRFDDIFLRHSPSGIVIHGVPPIFRLLDTDDLALLETQSLHHSTPLNLGAVLRYWGGLRLRPPHRQADRSFAGQTSFEFSQSHPLLLGPIT
jgi:hypothetical protein